MPATASLTVRPYKRCRASPDSARTRKPQPTHGKGCSPSSANTCSKPIADESVDIGGVLLVVRRLRGSRPLADDDLSLSRADGTRLPVRDYSREFSAQRKAAGLKAIPLVKLRHSNISRMRAAGGAADVGGA